MRSVATAAACAPRPQHERRGGAGGPVEGPQRRGGDGHGDDHFEQRETALAPCASHRARTFPCNTSMRPVSASTATATAVAPDPSVILAPDVSPSG